MSRIYLALVASLLLAWLAPGFASAADVADTAPQPEEMLIDIQSPVEAAKEQQIDISFSSENPGNLFQSGQPVRLTVHIKSIGLAQKAIVKTYVTYGLGSVVYADAPMRDLPKDTAVDETIVLGEDAPLPNGFYNVTVIVLGKPFGNSSTSFGVWNGPASQQSDFFGISYAGALNTNRTLSDLDLFKQAGIGWVRFPLHGWLPQGEAVPAEAEEYDTFIREATDRGFPLLAAFTPQMTADPSVNPVQADKDYHESLLAAASRYGFKVNSWELLRVKPAPFPPNLRGIDYQQLKTGREALRRFNKSLEVIFPLESPFAANASLLHMDSLPAKGDSFGFHYNFRGIPENQSATPKPPLYELASIASDTKKRLKRTPPMWATEYGFDPTKGSVLPVPMHQAALISRAIILNKTVGFEKTFWRHDPSNRFDLPLTNDTGGVNPGLLAIRNTLEMLNGITAIAPVQANIPNTHFFLMRTTDKDRQGGRTGVRNILVGWSETELSRTGIILRTSAQRITVTDLWGNIAELQPADKTAIFQIDEFPRFIDLGSDSRAEIRSTGSAISLMPKYKVVTAGAADNNVTFILRNDQFLFEGGITGTVNFSAWPVTSDVKSESYTLDPYGTMNVKYPIEIPSEDVFSGEILCEVRAEIMRGDRKIGFLTVPVKYMAALPGNESK